MPLNLGYSILQDLQRNNNALAAGVSHFAFCCDRKIEQAAAAITGIGALLKVGHWPI